MTKKEVVKQLRSYLTAAKGRVEKSSEKATSALDAEVGDVIQYGGKA